MKTLKISKVLIAIDYDPTAQKVAETGFSLAKSMKAHCILLHVISDMAYYSSTEYSPIMGFDGFLNIWPAQEASIESLKNATMLFLEKSKIHLGDPDIQ
ncbi:MAG: universal stress protein [Bacteroidales bacterium]|nr:universal stress protein [Bacteroidales bacterium]